MLQPRAATEGLRCGGSFCARPRSSLVFIFHSFPSGPLVGEGAGRGVLSARPPPTPTQSCYESPFTAFVPWQGPVPRRNFSYVSPMNAPPLRQFIFVRVLGPCRPPPFEPTWSALSPLCLKVLRTLHRSSTITFRISCWSTTAVLPRPF